MPTPASSPSDREMNTYEEGYQLLQQPPSNQQLPFHSTNHPSSARHRQEGGSASPLRDATNVSLSRRSKSALGGGRSIVPIYSTSSGPTTSSHVDERGNETQQQGISYYEITKGLNRSHTNYVPSMDVQNRWPPEARGALNMSGAFEQSQQGAAAMPSYNTTNAAVGSMIPRKRPQTSTSRSAVHQHRSSSSSHLSHSMHVPDAACCQYRNKESHESLKKVKGLFVTFCENSVEGRLVNATRELEVEREERGRDYEKYQRELAHILHDNNRLKRENEEMKKRMDTIDEDYGEQLKAMKTLRDEYERRWRQEQSISETARKELADTTQQNQDLRIDVGSRDFKIADLETQLKQTKSILERSEKQLGESEARTQSLYNERDLLRKKVEDLELDTKRLSDDLALKKRIIQGLEKELQTANDKLSSVAFFKESFSHAAARSGASQHTLQNTTLSSPKGKLYQKYFGKIPRQRTEEKK